MTEVDSTLILDAIASDSRFGKYVMFRLAHGEFGVAIDTVREVLEMLDVTVVPNSPSFVAGVVNLRGSVLPVIDLRRIFELPAESVKRPCIMIVRAALGSVEQVLGIVVDEVLQVLSIGSSDFLPLEEFQRSSEFGLLEPAPYLLGMVRIDGRIKLLLNISQVLNNLDLQHVAALPAAA